MTKPLPRKPYYGLAELCNRWSLEESDIAAYVLEGELTLSIAVAGVWVDTSDHEDDADGRWFLIPTGRRSIIGTMDLSRVNAFAVLESGSQEVGRFFSPTGEYLDLPDSDDHPKTLLVERHGLVVRRAEMERFEQAQGIGAAPAAGDALPKSSSLARPRGAPPKYDWEGCWCEIGKTIHEPGVPASQAEWMRQLLDWFEKRLGPDNLPSESSIKLRLSKIWPHVKPDVGRPSALTSIHGTQPVRGVQKVQSIGR